MHKFMYNAPRHQNPRPEDRELDAAEAKELLQYLVRLAELLNERIELTTRGGFRWPVGKGTEPAEVEQIATALVDERHRK